jgi:hypothetical protein
MLARTCLATGPVFVLVDCSAVAPARGVCHNTRRGGNEEGGQQKELVRKKGGIIGEETDISTEFKDYFCGC